jgi:Fe-S oxidoreductase
MPLPTGDVIAILADNLRLRGSVLPLSSRHATRWARGLGLPRGGETVLYTGQMYQLTPYIQGLVGAEERFGASPLARLTGLGRRLNRIVNVSAFLARPSRRERGRFDDVPRAVVRLLRAAGVEFGCLYEDDLYSGALAYDLGLDEVVARHAERVHRIMRRHGVRTVITIDPHTTNMLRSVYPELVPGWDVEVRSYVEVLAERDGAVAVAGPPCREVVLHDSCVFARYEDVVEEPRILLEQAGVTVREPANAGRQTWCCGGPAESLYPEKALAQARRRVEQLRAEGPECVTMCPLCLVNLSKAADGTIAFRDLSEVLLESRERAVSVRPLATV